MVRDERMEQIKADLIVVAEKWNLEFVHQISVDGEVLLQVAVRLIPRKLPDGNESPD